MLLNNHQQETVESHQKKISHVQEQRSRPNKTVWGAKLCLEPNPIPARDAQRAQTQPCVHQDPGQWSSGPTRDRARLAYECPGVSVDSGLPQGQGYWIQGLAEVLWKEDAITPTVVGLQAKPWEGTQYHSSTENWIKDLLSMAPSIRTRPRFPHSQSLPSGSFNNPLTLLHQRADRMKTTITEN